MAVAEQAVSLVGELAEPLVVVEGAWQYLFSIEQRV